jgi:hypothetical protein
MLASQQVINAIVTRLSGNTSAGTRVYPDRLWPVNEGNLPAWLVFADDEPIEALTMMWPPRQLHRMRVRLVGVVRSTTGIDEVMSALALQALNALFDTQAHQTLSPLAGVNLYERGRERRLPDDDQSPVAHLILTIEAQFSTFVNAPETLA